jgi:hypothetical protein
LFRERLNTVNRSHVGGVLNGSMSHVIPVSSTHDDSQGLQALEVVFHEAAHYLAQPGGPLSNALNTAAKQAGVTLPRDILHQVHFAISGEAVRRSFLRTGESYTRA